jgi:hypothetical protein
MKSDRLESTSLMREEISQNLYLSSICGLFMKLSFCVCRENRSRLAETRTILYLLRIIEKPWSKQLFKGYESWNWNLELLSSLKTVSQP